MDNKVLYKSDDFLEDNSSLKEISICVGADGYSFACVKPESREIEAFMHEPISLQSSSMHEYKFESVLLNNEWLTEPEYSKVNVLLVNGSAAFVPEECFSDISLDKYLVPTLGEDSELRYMKIEDKPLYLVFESFLWLETMLRQYFKSNDFRFSHILSALTDHAETTKKNIVVSCCLTHNHLYVSAVKSGLELVNYTSVNVASKEDILYYLLKQIRSLSASPNEVSINFSGEVESTFINLVKSNLRDYEIVVCKEGVSWDLNGQKDNRTKHYNLLSLCQCGS